MVLDAVDGDPDLESDKADEEPSLGWTVDGECVESDEREFDYVTYPHGTADGFTADMEPDIDADREPRLPPFELDQTNGRAL